VPRLSILIPCLGGAAEFDGTLVSLLQHRPDDCEVLVVHREPYSDPYDLAGEVTFLHAGEAETLVELVNLGIESARGEIVHLVGCGLEVEEGWAEPAMRHFADDETAAVAPVVLKADRKTVAAAGLMWTMAGTRRVCRSRSLTMLGPTLAAGFWRKSVLEALDGLEVPLGDELADVGLGLAIRHLNLKVVCESKSRVFQNENFVEQPAASAAAFGQCAERLFWRAATQSGIALPLALHPLAVFADSISRLPGMGTILSPLGRLLAWTELGAARQYQRKLVRADRLLTGGELDTPATVPLAASRDARQPAAHSRKAA
jgi:hypothetical protein